MEYSFQRYLLSKVSVDDRALNREVWSNLMGELAALDRGVSVLEIGAGIGTMAARLLRERVFYQVDYTAIDAMAENINYASQHLPEWMKQDGFQVKGKKVLGISAKGVNADVHLEAVDLYDFIQREAGRQTWDVVMAHAFLDLMDIPPALAKIKTLLHTGGLHYYSVNFDGVSVFEPVLDAKLDETILRLYHRSMDERVTDGKISGDSRAGRHLFSRLKQAGLDILAAGSSDWVVYPRHGSYPADEAYFLQFILHFFEETLSGHPELQPGDLEGWLEQRRRQVENGELVYIAHQMDFLSRQA